MLVYLAGGFVFQHPTKGCSSASILDTLRECKRAKAILDPSTSTVRTVEAWDEPKGCYLYEGYWSFNTHAKGRLDGYSEPVCKTAAGKANRI